MPIAYTCGNCGSEIDATDKIDGELQTVTCPKCGGELGEIGSDDNTLTFGV